MYENKSKVCLTTFIYGDSYQAYIPFLIYSCHKSNPEYDLVLFVHGSLSASVRESLNILDACNYRIIENTFNDCPQMTPLKSMALRWVLWDDSFLEYDYIYIVDIDMLYLKENMPLHKQHLIHMNVTGLSYDNMRRRYILNPFCLKSVLRRIKHAGFKSFFSFMFGKRVIYRATGLHFISVADYYRKFTKSIREKFLISIYNNQWLKDVMIPDNEALLYHILEEAGLTPNLMPTQSNSYASIEFRNPSREEFRPHHGIHLGLFRFTIGANEKLILDSPAYKYYVEVFKTNLLNDTIFNELLARSPSYIKLSINMMYEYYDFKSEYKV